MINVFLVDDHELVRAGIEALLNNVNDITVIGVAKSGGEAVDAVATMSADVVLMDINMAGMSGLEACRRILQQDAEVKIIAVSVRNEGPIPYQLLRLGVLGFVSKDSPANEMIYAIGKVMEGKRYLCSEVANNLALQGLPGSCHSPFAMLSQREAEVVTLILQGNTIQEMAKNMMLSDKTINTYRYRLYNKLRVKNDVELIRMAIKFGYIDGAMV